MSMPEAPEPEIESKRYVCRRAGATVPRPSLCLYVLPDQRFARARVLCACAQPSRGRSPRYRVGRFGHNGDRGHGYGYGYDRDCDCETDEIGPEAQACPEKDGGVPGQARCAPARGVEEEEGGRHVEDPPCR